MANALEIDLKIEELTQARRFEIIRISAWVTFVLSIMWAAMGFFAAIKFFIPAAITICASLLAVVFLNTRFHLLVRLLWVGFTWIAVTIGILLVSKNSSAAILYTGFAGGAFLVFSVQKERAYIIFFVLISIMAWITRWGLEDDLLGIMVVSDPLALRYVDLLAVLSVLLF